jgi:hypothetical protein
MESLGLPADDALLLLESGAGGDGEEQDQGEGEGDFP